MILKKLHRLGILFKNCRKYSTLGSVVKDRRSIRKYLDIEIPKQLIEEIISTGVWAPSAKNMQPLKFYVVSNESKLQEISDFTIEQAGSYRSDHLFFKANTVIFIFWKDGAEKYVDLDVGLALMNMQLKIHELNLSSCIIGFSKYGETKIREICEVTDNDEIYGIAMTLGYPDESEEVIIPERAEPSIKYIE